MITIYNRLQLFLLMSRSRFFFMSQPSLPSETRAHVIITGIVQGVGYRVSTLYQARRLKIAGWVRNLPDGRVEAVFEGTQEAVNAIVDWCHQGPRGALVENIAVDFQTPQGELNFEIRHR
jgi:acylphosphatase